MKDHRFSNENVMAIHTAFLILKNKVMENVYHCYSRQVQNLNYYFVKRYLHFPEYANVPDFMEGYGMHQDFFQACAIAGIKNAAVCQDLYHSLHQVPQEAKVISLEVFENVSKRITG